MIKTVQVCNFTLVSTVCNEYKSVLRLYYLLGHMITVTKALPQWQSENGIFPMQSFAMKKLEHNL